MRQVLKILPEDFNSMQFSDGVHMRTPLVNEKKSVLFSEFGVPFAFEF